MKQIYIDAGHGGATNSGAIGHFDGVTILEKEYNLRFAILLNEFINNCRPLNCGSHLTRMDDENFSFPIRAAIASDADLYISIHCNSNAVSSAHGFETYVLPNQPKAYDIAVQIQAAVPRCLYRRKDPIIADVAHGEWMERPINVIECVKGPAILLELGFLSNYNDFGALRTESVRNGICAAIMTGLAIL